VSGPRIAVTGASGFCGAEVARLAARQGAEVICLGRRPGPVGRHVPWDASRDRPDLAGADAVIHLAATVGDPGPGRDDRYHAVNVDGTRRLLAAAGSRPVVWVSSASVYDPGTDRSRVTEEHPVSRQLSAYGRTKAAGERLALDAGAVVLRPRAVYGSGDPHLVPRLHQRIRAGVLVLPGPDVRISLTAVENLADACLAGLGWPAGAYNVADAEPYRRDAVIRAVLAAHGTAVRIRHLPVVLVDGIARLVEAGYRLRPRGQPWLTRYAVDQLAHDVVLDIGKATARGWQPRRTIDDYLRAVVPAS
jgi:nucleoside-diphosphate-sugar epimerase